MLRVKHVKVIVQAGLEDVLGLGPDLCNKVRYHNKRAVIFLLTVRGGERASCLQFVKKATSVKCNKAKSNNKTCNKTRSA